MSYSLLFVFFTFCIYYLVILFVIYIYPIMRYIFVSVVNESYNWFFNYVVDIYKVRRYLRILYLVCFIFLYYYLSSSDKYLLVWTFPIPMAIIIVLHIIYILWLFFINKLVFLRFLYGLLFVSLNILFIYSYLLLEIGYLEIYKSKFLILKQVSYSDLYSCKYYEVYNYYTLLYKLHNVGILHCLILDLLNYSSVFFTFQCICVALFFDILTINLIAMLIRSIQTYRKLMYVTYSGCKPLTYFQLFKVILNTAYQLYFEYCFYINLLFVYLFTICFIYYCLDIHILIGDGDII